MEIDWDRLSDDSETAEEEHLDGEETHTGYIKRRDPPPIRWFNSRRDKKILCYENSEDNCEEGTRYVSYIFRNPQIDHSL